MMQTTFKMQFDSPPPPKKKQFLNKESGWKPKFLKSETHKASRSFHWLLVLWFEEVYGVQKEW